MIAKEAAIKGKGVALVLKILQHQLSRCLVLLPNAGLGGAALPAKALFPRGWALRAWRHDAPPRLGHRRRCAASLGGLRNARPRQRRLRGAARLGGRVRPARGLCVLDEEQALAGGLPT